MRDNFGESILADKQVSIWGVGYLGYTTLLQLQARGFRARIWDIEEGRLDGLLSGVYPEEVNFNNWSAYYRLSSIDLDKIEAVRQEQTDVLFASKVHMICTPGEQQHMESNLLRRIAEIFLAHKAYLQDSLVVFQAAERPGSVEEFFIDYLREHGLQVDCVSVFRSDWMIESFIANRAHRVMGGTSPSALAKGRAFFEMLGVQVEELPSIMDCEIYENAKNVLMYIANAFVNQLSVTFPGRRIDMITRMVMQNTPLNEVKPNFGIGSFRMIQSAYNLFMSSSCLEDLSLVKEAQGINTGNILKYADYILKNGYRSVTIWGLSSVRNVRLLEISPAVVLAEYLHRNEVAVHIDDHFYSPEEIKELLPFASVANMDRDGLTTEVLFALSGYYQFQFYRQQDLDRLGISRASLILDNDGFLSNFRFSENTVYHSPGMGNIDLFETRWTGSCAE